jgi:hypothetical protein
MNSSYPSVETLVAHFDYQPEAGVLIRKSKPSGSHRSPSEEKRWNTRFANTKAGSESYTESGKKSKIQVSFNGSVLAAHKIAWAIYYGCLPDGFIDHINGDPFDNRIANLRLCNNTTNQWNRGVPRNSTSGAKGVTWSKKMAKWKATIRTNGDYFHLGYHDSKGMAALAVAKKSLQLHGKFSVFYRSVNDPAMISNTPQQ